MMAGATLASNSALLAGVAQTVIVLAEISSRLVTVIVVRAGLWTARRFRRAAVGPTVDLVIERVLHRKSAVAGQALVRDARRIYARIVFMTISVGRARA